MKYKILFVLGSLGRGGAEHVVTILANDYVEKDWEVHICMLLSNKVEYNIDNKIVLHDLSNGGGSRIKRTPYWLNNIRKTVKTVQPDKIVSFAARINLLVLAACLGLKKDIFVSERNDPKYDGRGKIVRMGTSLLYPRSKKIIFQTKRATETFNNKIKAKGVIIPNPIEVNCAYTGKNIHTIVSVGRLTPQKNQLLLIRAFKPVVEKYPDAQLVIYGEGSLRKTLESEITRLNLKENVFLPGMKKNVLELMKDAGIFVMSSDYEGLSNALLEAMAMGFPCISTNCAGADEYITDHENGLLVQVGDENGLSNAMIELFENNALREKCAQNAQQINDKIAKHHVIGLWHNTID